MSDLSKLSCDTTHAIAILDVAYSENAAGVACVLANSWTSDAPCRVMTRHLEHDPKPYEPGKFYKRELPFLIDILESCPEPIGAVVVDGYVWLGRDRTPGLGAALFDAMAQKIPIVGVAKSRFRNDDWSDQVLRGKSKRALFVTAVGLDQHNAATLVGSMHGNHRIPTLISLTDTAARTALKDARPS